MSSKIELALWVTFLERNVFRGELRSVALHVSRISVLATVLPSIKATSVLKKLSKASLVEAFYGLFITLAFFSSTLSSFFK